MKRKIIERLHEIQMIILKADDAELNKIGIELLDIEKQLMQYVPANKRPVYSTFPSKK